LNVSARDTDTGIANQVEITGLDLCGDGPGLNRLGPALTVV